MDVAGGNANNDNKIQAWSCDSSGNQVFSYDPSEAKTQIKWTTQPNKCLDVQGGATESGTPVILWDCHDLNDDSRDHQAFLWTGSQFQWQQQPSKCLTLKDGVV